MKGNTTFDTMYYVRLMCLLISATSFLFMVLGLIKPWIMLWWEDVQNRKKILKVYGSCSLLFLMAYFLLGFI